MTTRRENLLAVYRHERPEWIPIVPHIDGYQVPTGLPEELAQDLNIVTFSRYLGTDILDRAQAFTAEREDVVYTKDEGGTYIVERWETPVGVLTKRTERMVWEVADSHGVDPKTAFPIEFPIKTVEDMRIYRFIMEGTVYRPDHEGVAARRSLVGDDGIVTAAAPNTPIGAFNRDLMGPEALTYLAADYPREFGELVEVMTAKYLEACQVAASTDIDGTINYDDTSSRLWSKRMFREIGVPYLRRCADVLRSAGKVYIHHSCGHMRAFLDDLAAAHVDGWDALTSPPDGDVTVAEARRVLGDEVVLQPVVPQTIVDRASLDEIRAFVREMYRQAAPGWNFVLWAVPSAGVPIDRFRALIDEARECSTRVG